MEKMNLSYIEKVSMLAITKDECNRLISLLDQGKALFYEGQGGRITLENGVMTVSGFEEVPTIFGVKSSSGYIDTDATFNLPLKKRVHTIVFGEETKVITYRAFNDYRQLCHAVIPDSVERICSPFENCKKLLPYPLPKALTYISGDAYGIFPDEIILPDKVERIGSFFAKSGVRSVTLSPALKQIGMREFYKCSNLERVIFPEGLEIIGEEAFSYCTKLSELIFPRSLQDIEAYAFAHCHSLSRVIITADTEIDSNAFLDSPFHKEVQRLRFDAFTPVEYDGDPSVLTELEKMRAVLSGKAYSEQAKHFKLITNSVEETYSYGESESEKESGGAYPLGDESEVENLIVFEGIIVGAIIRGVRVYLNQDTCIYSATEDDGTGSRSVFDYRCIRFEENP